MHAESLRRHNKDERHSLLEKYTSHFIWKVACERELETEQNCNILTPTLMAISVSFPLSRAAQLGAWRLTLQGAGFLYCILSPTGLISKLTDFLSSPSYIIVQSPTQYLWNGMFDRHQAEITVMQFTGDSLPVHQSMILPCPILSAKPAYAISSHNCHRNVSLPPSLEWHVWPGRRSIYNNSNLWR